METLFVPTRLGDIALSNRIVMAPLTRQRADRLGVPQPHVAVYYAQRASAGLIIAEGTQPSFEGQGYCRTPGIHTAEQIAAWRSVTDAVHARGGKMVLQIMHAGRIGHPLNRHVETPLVAPSAIAAPGTMWTDEEGMQPHPIPRALETRELPGIVEEFVTAARNAIAAGFDGVELHAANGYLLNQFLSSNTNQRTDGYGGSLAGRIRLVAEATEAVGAAIGLGRTGIRVSPGHMFNDLVDERPIETHAALLDALPTGQMAYVHLMRPDSFSPQLNNAGDADTVITALKPHVKGPFLAAGLYTRESGAAALARREVDAVVYGRPFIANPDLVKRFLTGAPLADAQQDKFYTPGPEGYSDYPALATEAA